MYSILAHLNYKTIIVYYTDPFDYTFLYSILSLRSLVPYPLLAQFNISDYWGMMSYPTPQQLMQTHQ